MKPGLLCCVLLAFAATALPQQDRSPHGAPGNFDYYLLTLSWSPQFCHSKPGDPQCSQHLGFVLHGFWPQDNSGDYPHNCPTNLRATPSMSQHIPAAIVQHEWQTHGACAAPAETPQHYLQEADHRFDSIRIPPEFKSPKAAQTMSYNSLVAKFLDANPGMKEENISPHCQGGWLQEIRICVGKSSGYVPCTVTSSCSTNRPIRIDPVR